VVKAHPAIVVIDERESRAVDFSRIYFQSCTEALGKDCFARAEVACEQEDRRLGDRFTDPVSQLECLFG